MYTHTHTSMHNYRAVELFSRMSICTYNLAVTLYAQWALELESAR